MIRTALAATLLSLAVCTGAFSAPAPGRERAPRLGRYELGIHRTGIVATLTNPNGIICLYVGQSFSVTLEDHSASTGYVWQMSNDHPEIVRLMSTSISLGDGIGVPGRRGWIFTALRRGVAHITFQEVRPWAGGGAGPLNQITVNVF